MPFDILINHCIEEVSNLPGIQYVTYFFAMAICAVNFLAHSFLKINCSTQRWIGKHGFETINDLKWIGMFSDGHQ